MIDRKVRADAITEEDITSFINKIDEIQRTRSELTNVNSILVTYP